MVAPVDGKLPLTIALCAVLDTNVVLDWLVFANPDVRGLSLAIQAGHMRWLQCAAMRAELAHVLANARLGDRCVDAEQVLTLADRFAVAVEDPPSQSLTRLRCSDESDQIFIDLALRHQVRWLLTRDRALLRLARKVAPLGLLVQVPEAWRLPTPSASAD